MQMSLPDTHMPTLVELPEVQRPDWVEEVLASHATGYPRFRNDYGVPEIRIGVKVFFCIGVSPPHDHPHVYLDMGRAGMIPCPYCATRFRFDPRLDRLETDPPNCLVAGNPARR